MGTIGGVAVGAAAATGLLYSQESPQNQATDTGTTEETAESAPQTTVSPETTEEVADETFAELQEPSYDDMRSGFESLSEDDPTNVVWTYECKGEDGQRVAIDALVVTQDPILHTDIEKRDESVRFQNDKLALSLRGFDAAHPQLDTIVQGALFVAKDRKVTFDEAMSFVEDTLADPAKVDKIQGLDGPVNCENASWRSPQDRKPNTGSEVQWSSLDMAGSAQATSTEATPTRSR